MWQTSKGQDGQARLQPMRVTRTSYTQSGPCIKRTSSLWKKHLGGWHFRTEAEVQQAILACHHDLDADFFYTSFDKLMYRWNK
ncbi:hypothetical protein AVEN_83174-1 [Araneus ventricosus]|uniref:Uncharacterized protein n=1 Tax=Araneus ventricosus TaxID=182803 RepID=A0A4Y2AN00_ARAVE|nr:hypothetical protein AVEN_83174-1 [Araneus ventricosus]